MRHLFKSVLYSKASYNNENTVYDKEWCLMAWLYIYESFQKVMSANWKCPFQSNQVVFLKNWILYELCGLQYPYKTWTSLFSNILKQFQRIMSKSCKSLPKADLNYKSCWDNWRRVGCRYIQCSTVERRTNHSPSK